jgi:carboxylesterase type B
MYGSVPFSDLFHRGIMQSGSDRSEWAIIKSTSDAQRYAVDLADELGCPTGDMFRLTQCLREYRSYGEIVNASSKVRLKVSEYIHCRLL